MEKGAGALGLATEELRGRFAGLVSTDGVDPHRAMEEGLDAVTLATEELRTRLTTLVATDGIDTHQVAANEFVWAVAYREAATATLEWARASHQDVALEVAAAAIAEACNAVCGGSVLSRVEAAKHLEWIASRQQPLLRLCDSAEQHLLRETFRGFARTQVEPLASEIHRRDSDIPNSLIERLAELGAFGLSVPREYGGVRDGDDLEAMLVVTEELSRASLSVGSLSTRPEILVRALLRGGTEDQRTRWLPGIANGRFLVAVATTEADHGSDVASLACRATRVVDGGWEVSGTKLWCTFAGRAELLMLLLRTGDPGHRGLSLFVAEKPAFSGRDFVYEQPAGGSLVGRAIPTIGYRGMHTFELAFDRLLLPIESLVGGEEWLNRGFYLQMEGFSSGRLQTAARAVGLMQAAVEDSLMYAAQRRAFGRHLDEFHLTRAMLGRMIVRLISARQLARRAGSLLDDQAGHVQAALAKLFASRMAEYVTRDAVQLHGGMGYAEETNVSRYFVDARVLSIFEGTEEVLALRVIAKSLLSRH